MAKSPVETADPRQYLRLMLIRLLETQKCLAPLINNPAFAALKLQYQTNEYTLQEIRSWLEGSGDSSPLGPSSSIAQSAVKSGPESCEQLPALSRAPAGPQPSPFAWRTFSPTVPRGSSQVQSSLPSGVTLPDSAEITNGRITFRPKSSGTTPNSPSSGGGHDAESKE